MRDKQFTIGQQVVAVKSEGYIIQEGHRYTVTGYTDEQVTPYFTYPHYVHVIDDHGKESSWHEHRFKAIV